MNLVQAISLYNQITASIPLLVIALIALLGSLSMICSVLTHFVSPSSKLGLVVHTLALTVGRVRNQLIAYEASKGIADPNKPSITPVVALFIAFALLYPVKSYAQTPTATPTVTPTQTTTPTNATPNACSANSTVQCTSGLAVAFSTFGYQKTGTRWNVVPTVGLGPGYQFRQEFFGKLLLAEIVYGGFSDTQNLAGFDLTVGLTIGYQWNGTSCNIGLAEDLFDLAGGKSSGIFTPFSSLANTHWLINLGFPIL
jgi:hypothetical protein